MKNKLRLKIRHSLYFLLGSLFLLGSCDIETNYELRSKVVLSKTTIKDDFKIAFTDGSDCNVRYGLYELVDKGDTVVFKCVEGMSFHRWNCSFVHVKKRQK